MLPIKALLSTAILASTALAAATNQVALYWGQNGVGLEEAAGGQERLAAYCDNSDVDIVLLSFLNFFPDPLNLNFANQCGDTFESGLLHCQRIGEDIKTCQANGKKVLLSLGGAAGNYGFESTGSATEFATTLWNKFGAGEDDERPFDDAIVDGFDFDIERPNANGDSLGYPELATALRSKFSEDSSKQYYLSAAPQCPYPDALLGDLLNQVPLDYAFIQFYNNPCSIDQQFNYATWQTFAESAPNSDIQLFVGVPATSNIAGYVDAQELSAAIDQIKCDANFAGVSLWDASGAWSNVDGNGDNYAAQVKRVLNDNVCEEPSSSTSSEEPSSTEESTTEESDSEEPSTTEEPSAEETSAEESITEEPSAEETSAEESITEEPSAEETFSSSSSSAHYYGNSTTSSTTSSSSFTSTQAGGSASITATTTTTTGSSSKASSTTGTGSGNGLVTVTDIHQTVITVTSCSENKCHATPVTTGYVVVTDLHTVYTTYCPLTNSEVVVPVKTATVKSTTIATESCSTTATTAGANKEVVTEASAAPATTTTTTAKGAEYPKTVAAGSTTTITTTKGHKEEQGAATTSTTSKAAESSSTGAPAPVVVVSSAASSAPASASGVVVASSAVPVGTSAGETIYTTIEVTSTIVPYPIPTSVVSAHNGTYGAGNGTAPVVTYEGAAAGVNGLNSAWFTLPLMLAALAF